MSSPRKFDELVRAFRHGVDSGRVASAYLIIGAPRGEGLFLAQRILQMLYCAGPEKPCGSCEGCRHVRERTHADVLWIEPQKKSQRILVDQVREIQRRMYETSFTGGWKSCVLIGADRLGEEAANAFLKTLEEPPGPSLFLLLTDSPHSLLPTIQSRCQRVTLSAEQEDLPGDLWREVRQVLRAGKAGPLEALAQARKLAGFLKKLRKDTEAEEWERAGEDEEKDVVEARINARYKEKRTLTMRALLLWHRDVLMLVIGADPDFVKNRDDESMALLREFANRLTYAQGLRNVRTIERMYDQLERNIPEDSVLSIGFGQMAADR